MSLNIVLSSTQIDDTEGCLRYFQYKDVLRLSLPGQDTHKRDRGTLFHKLLEKYYKAKMQHIKIDEELVVAIMNWGRSEGHTLNLEADQIELTVRRFRDYCIRWRGEDYIIEGVEESYIKEIYADDKYRIALEGTTDLRVKNSQGLKIVLDHKTGAFKQGLLSNQFFTYSFLSDCKYVIENWVPLSSKDPKFERPIYEYDPRLVEEWKLATIQKILKVAKAQEESYYTTNFTQCHRFGICPYYRLCEQPEKYRAGMIAAEFEVVEDSHYKERFSSNET